MQENVTIIYTTDVENYVGLFAYLFRVIVTMYDLYPGKVYIDWSQPGSYQNAGENKNLWEVLFEQPDVQTLSDDYIISRRLAHHVWRKENPWDESVGEIKDKFLQDAVFYPTMEDRIGAKKIIDEKIKIKSEIQNIINSFFNEKIAGKRCLAVHRRGCNYLHNNSITDDMFNTELLNVLNSKKFDSVFLCADNRVSKNNLKDFIEKQNIEVITYDSHIANNPADNVLYYHEEIPINRNLLLIEAFIEVYLMSKCDAFYRSSSSVSTFVLFLNPQLQEYHVNRNLIYR